MADDFLTVEVDTSHIQSQLQKFNKEIPRVAKKLMKSVNAEVRKQIFAEARSRGYHGSKKQTWGDSGYRKNLKTYENNDFSAKVMMGRDAYYYRFIEYGADVKPRHGDFLYFKADGKLLRTRGFSYPARPLIYPIANSIWGTSKADRIMEESFQKELDKIFRDEAKVA